MGEVVAALRAAETALVLVAADAGVQIGTIRVWRRLEQRGLPRLVFINKMDKEHADFAKCLADLREKFQVNFVPVTMPIGKAGRVQGRRRPHRDEGPAAPGTAARRPARKSPRR